MSDLEAIGQGNELNKMYVKSPPRANSQTRFKSLDLTDNHNHKLKAKIPYNWDTTVSNLTDIRQKDRVDK